jgi:DNA-directed RNA polymerase specialized sigma24 family protein
MPASTPSSPFATTRWSIVLAAGHWQSDSTAHRAMSELAALYWFPLYAYLRRQGQPSTQAQDLLQGFFLHLLQHDALAAIDRSKGKFRSFLLASLNNFLANERDRALAQKRGGGHTPLSLDTSDAESRYVAQPADDLTPERAFERRWAWGILDHVLAELRTSYLAAGKGPLFDALKGALTSSADAPDYGQLASDLHMSRSALQVAAHRLRRRYRELLRHHIAQTVASPDLVDEEIAYLLSCL